MLSCQRQVHIVCFTDKALNNKNLSLFGRTLLVQKQKASKRRFFRCKRGLETLTAVLMLILMIVAMTEIIVAFSTYNSSIQKQMNIEKERAQEQIAITEINTKNEQEITTIKIVNIGQIEVRIRALYREIGSAATFLMDPSINVAPSSSKILNITSLGLIVDPNAVLVAATQRGTKSKGANELMTQREQHSVGVDTSGLTIGPLMLTFNSLNWAKVDSSGNVIGQWQETWTIPTGPCSWRLNLTNLDSKNRTLTITQYSGFTTSLVSSPVTTTWYLKATQYVIGWNQTEVVTFLWDITRTSSVSAGSNSKGVNNVFLTLFGSFSDGETYAQTIPFEAITIV